MDIARLLTCDDSDIADRHPHMDVARLLNHDDSDQSDQEPLEGVVFSATPPLGSMTLATPPQWSGAPATSQQGSVTPLTPQQKPETPTTLSRKSTASAPIPERAVTPALPSKRAVARARPSRPRKPSIQSLRAQVEAFEFVVKYLPYVLRDLEDASSATSIANAANSEEDDPGKSGDHDVQRMRSFLKRTILLTKEAQEEIAKRTEYLRLLKRHYEGTANLHKLMRGVRLDYWFWMCERWRSLTHDYYEPLLDVRASY